MSKTFEMCRTSDEWKFWCRLCATENSRNINVLSEMDSKSQLMNLDFNSIKFRDFIEQFFQVRIEEDGDLSHWLCTQCFSLISALVKFSEHVKNVQNMYDAIQRSVNRKTLDLKVFRENYNLLGNELFIFNLSDIKSKVENISIEPNIIVKESLDSIVKSEIISDEVRNGVFCNKFEYKSEYQDPLGDGNENVGSDIESFNSGEKQNEEKNIKVDQSELNEQFPNRLSANKHNKKLKKRLCISEEDSKEQKYFCSDCSMHFQRLSNYSSHMKKRHGIIYELDPLTCPQCAKAFPSKSRLNRHIKTHRPLAETRIFPCPLCDRKFQAKDYVSTHIKLVHEDIRPFICEECGEGARTKATLRDHMLTHTGLAPFECEVCKKRFKNRAQLKKHMEIHSSNKHICSECGLQLNSRITLNRHMLVHSDVMRHKCDYCGKAFKRAKTLKLHLILHTGLKPYSCDFCERTFAAASNCRTHKRKSHPNELAVLEASGENTYTKNIPTLTVLKTVTRSAENLTPVVCKQSGNFSLGRKPKIPFDCTGFTKHSNSSTSIDPLNWLLQTDATRASCK
ncbi:zinc finger protein 718-like isoform X1 [Anastrepha obliqua]|uniref:zinc finger protein 718-like isoform X1 n=2 Tax=Anastrepha obliqua TaxID=95512 RepID=UPI00240A5C87|nr:zinc finger protein 718-like isoform X1 [Anastrepha obliqua]